MVSSRQILNIPWKNPAIWASSIATDSLKFPTRTIAFDESRMRRSSVKEESPWDKCPVTTTRSRYVTGAGSVFVTCASTLCSRPPIPPPSRVVVSKSSRNARQSWVPLSRRVSKFCSTVVDHIRCGMSSIIPMPSSSRKSEITNGTRVPGGYA